MNITPVSEVLAPEGLVPPRLNALIPNANNYKALLMQPHGHIAAGAAGVRNSDRDLARKQFGAFIADAKQTQADLAVTPEYSMPWETLVEKVKNDIVPAQGKLWVLGCESIKLSELNELKQSLEPFASLIYEPLEENNDKFVSPLVYLFFAPKADGNDHPCTVMLVQFKTHPMGDPNHFEINGMQRGSHVYQFGGNGGSLRLISLICSDVFAFEDHHAAAIYDRTLILHIQLNQKPRNENFYGCRQRLLRFEGDATEILCLNWARNVVMCCGEQITPWNNIAGSAWYLKPAKFDDGDETLNANHRRGLYYTWLMPLRSHALFFNYSPATFLLNVTKVVHIGVQGPISKRRGPQLIRASVWDNEVGAWSEQDNLEDGFSKAVNESGNAINELSRIAQNNPLGAERVLALCAGTIDHGIDWHNVCRLDSCIIDASEVIHRLTFCQDKRAQNFRNARLRRCGRLWDIITTDHRLPPSLADFKEGVQLSWNIEHPHQNAISAKGKHATVIYMGEESSSLQIEATAKKAIEYLHRGFSDPDESHNAKQRLAVWFRDTNDEITLYEHNRFTKIDNPGNISEFDIGREE
jgi:hypothetical protein